jgi:hypothetical protein
MPPVEAKDLKGRASGDLSEHSRPVNGKEFAPGILSGVTKQRFP